MLFLRFHSINITPPPPLHVCEFPLLQFMFIMNHLFSLSLSMFFFPFLSLSLHLSLSLSLSLIYIYINREREGKREREREPHVCSTVCSSSTSFPLPAEATRFFRNTGFRMSPSPGSRPNVASTFSLGVGFEWPSARRDSYLEDHPI